MANKSIPHRQAALRRSAAVKRSNHQQEDGLPPPTTEQLEAALVEVVDALFVHRRRRANEKASRRSPLQFAFSYEDFTKTPDAVLIARDLVANPVDDALRDKIKEIGSYIAPQLTFSELQRLVERVSNASTIDAERRFYAIEKCFDGLQTRDGDHWIA